MNPTIAPDEQFAVAFDTEEEAAEFTQHFRREFGETGQLVPAVNPPNTENEWFEWSDGERKLVWQPTKLVWSA